ncbi:MAG: LuxR family transcriptional regulator, partial [Actinomycetes bacterium]
MDGHLQRTDRPVPLHISPDHQVQPAHAAELVAKQLKGANAAVRELLLALSVGFALPGPLPADLQQKFITGAVEDL